VISFLLQENKCYNARLNKTALYMVVQQRSYSEVILQLDALIISDCTGEIIVKVSQQKPKTPQK